MIGLTAETVVPTVLGSDRFQEAPRWKNS
jgi:hypothetical protein